MSFQNCKVVGKNVNPDAYHAQESQRGDKDYIISPSALREFAHCPKRWQAGYQPPESDAKDWGSLFDTLALTPDQFSDRYAIEPLEYKNEKNEVKPWNNNATVCRKWHEDNDSKQVVKNKSVVEAQDAIRAMLTDDVIAAWFKASDRQVLVVGEWASESGLVIPVRCLLDFAPRADTEFSACLGDLKTCRTAALMPFQRDAFRMGYHIQAAFDLDLFNAATKQERNTWCWVLSESYPPYQSGKRMLSQEFLEFGRASYTRLLENYSRCVESGNWPGYDDHDEAVQSWTLVAPEPWMQSAELFAPKLEFDAEIDESPTEK